MPIRIATWVLILIGLAGLTTSATALTRVGLSWDAGIDTTASIEVTNLNDHLSLADAYTAVYSTSEFYGNLVYRTAVAAHSFLGRSSGDLTPDRLDTYRWQSGVTLGFTLLGTLALAYAMAVALRSRLAGAFTWALVWTLPLFAGMSFIDTKDMPVAAGLTMFSAGLILARDVDDRRIRIVVAYGSASLGAFMALGTRIGSWPLLAGLALASLGVYVVANLATRSRSGLLHPALVAGTAALVSVLGLMATNPLARIDLPRWAYDAYVISSGYPWTGTIRVAGVDVASDALPAWYVPAWLLAQLPVLVTAMVVLGLVVAAIALVRSRWILRRAEIVRLAPLFIQGLLIPIGIVAIGTVLYDGIRHLLFMIPALLAIGSLGIVVLERLAPRRRHIGAVVLAACVLVSGASLWAEFRWYPYFYAYINPIAGWDKSHRNWELDYWGVTALEGVDRLHDLGAHVLTVSPEPDPHGLTQVRDIWLPGQRGSLPPGPYGSYAFGRWDEWLDPAACTRDFTIVRDGLTLGEGGMCHGH